jgi:hypothetical protein
MELLRLLARQRLLKVGEKGIMTIGTKEAVEREANNLALLLQKYKLDPSAFNDIGSLKRTVRGLEELDLANALKTKAPPPDNVIEGKFGKSFSEEIKDMEDVMKKVDLPQKDIDKEKEFLERSMKKNIAEATEKGDFTGIANQVLRDKDIMREFMLSKKFPFSPDKNVFSGEDAIPLARKAKFDEETKQMGISLTPGKDAKGTVDEFVNQMKRFKVSDKDIQSMLKSGKSGQVDYVMEQYGLSASDVADILKGGKPLIEGMADGGRIGLKEGYRPGAPIDPLDPQRKLSEAMDAYDKYYKGPGKKVRKIPFMKFFEIYAKENFADGGRVGLKIGSSKKTATGDYEGFDLSYLKDLSPEVQKAFLRRLYTGNMTKQADGGRVGLKVGSMSRRAFLKMLAALGITGAAAKSGIVSLGGKQTGKQVVKEVIKTPNVAGKPEWFDSLVNKVIAEGVDKTDDLAYKERMVVHTKKINPNEEVAVYQDLEDGSVRINVGGHMTDKDGKVIRAVNDPDQVDLIVRKGKTEEGGFKTKDSFEATESEPRVANQDGDIEFDGENVVNNVDDLMQDVSNLEEYATGKKLTGTKKKKAVEKQEKFQKFTEDRLEQAEYIENKYGPGGDYASGGIARMLGE